MWCQHCGYKLSFLMQIYANIDDPSTEHVHRMLYVFVCLSEECIGSQNAVRVFRCIIPDDNKFLKFASDEDFDKIFQKTDNQLISMGLIKPPKKEKAQEAQKE